MGSLLEPWSFSPAQTAQNHFQTDDLKMITKWIDLKSFHTFLSKCDRNVALYLWNIHHGFTSWMLFFNLCFIKLLEANVVNFGKIPKQLGWFM